jgi:hypothetical protein
MRVFVAERRLPGASRLELANLQDAALCACRAFAQQGRPVRYLRSVYLPSEGLCLCLFEAPCAARVRDVNEAGALPFSRILEVWEL